MELCLIWAQARCRAIGRANTLPWHLPEDLKHFKATTLGCPVIMGRKTFESLPGGALPGRDNIVVTRSPQDFATRGARAVGSLDEALASVAQAERAFVIGGAELYALALPLADRLFITEVEIDVPDADAFAPELPLTFFTYRLSPRQVSRTQIEYRFTEYLRGFAAKHPG